VPVEDDAALAEAIAAAIESGERPSGMREIAESYSIAASVEDHLRIAGHQT
jgi:hypothetical protein